MAITINGTGSITGLTAGGLPDGSITTDDLAANAVTAAKLAAGAGGKILQVASSSYATATTQSTGTYADSGLTGSITPVAAGSKILVMVNALAKTFALNNWSNGHGAKLLEGSTTLYVTGDEGLGFTGEAARSSPYGMDMKHYVVINHLYSPTYTLGDTLSYKIQMRPYYGSSTISVTHQYNDTPSTMQIWEIAA